MIGSPSSLLKLPAVRSVPKRRETAFASSSLVVVLPTAPATARTRAGCPRRHQPATPCRARRGCSTSNSSGRCRDVVWPGRRGCAGAEVQHADVPAGDRRLQVLRDAGDERRPGPVGEGAGDEVVPVPAGDVGDEQPPGAHRRVSVGERGHGHGAERHAVRSRRARRQGAARPRLPPSARPGGGPGRRRRDPARRRRRRWRAGFNAAGSLSHSRAGAGRPGPPPARPRDRCAGGRPRPR